MQDVASESTWHPFGDALLPAVTRSESTAAAAPGVASVAGFAAGIAEAAAGARWG
mgnify:CR=1 FL=1